MTHFKEKQEDETTSFGKSKILKNLFLLCLVFFMTFTANDCLGMLQSTLNHKQGIGVICQATSYGCCCISSLLLPKYCIKKLGCKLTLVVSMSLYLPYIASNLYPHWSFMVPTAAVSGSSATLLWGALNQYVNQLAVQYAVLTREKKKKSKSEDTKTTSDDAISSHSDNKILITDYSECDKQNGSIAESETSSHDKMSRDHNECDKQDVLNAESGASSFDKMSRPTVDCSELDKQKVSNAENGASSLDILSKNYSEYDKQNGSNAENGPTHDILSSSIHETQKKEPSNFISKTDPKDNSFSTKSLYEASEKTISEITSQKDFESTAARFFGLHSLAYLLTHVCSNAMSYSILQNNAFHSNVTLNASCVCGAQYCNEKSDCFLHNLLEPSLEKRYLLIGVCFALGVVAVMIMAVFLDTLDDRNKNVTFSIDFLLATGKQLKTANQVLLTPLSFYIGMMQGFYAGDFNLSFVGCAWGTFHVALVSACYGASCSLSAPVSGWLVKLTGRVPIFTFAALVNFAAQILMLLWNPSAENPEMFFVLAALWGTTLGILYSQITAMYGVLFKDNQEAAFAAYHLWYALGIGLSFAYSNQLCTYVKIYAVTSVLIVGFVGYLSVEMRLRFQIKKK